MEFIANWCGALCAFGYSAVFLGLGVPMALRKVPRNRLYGFRIRATLADDDVWYPVNEMAGRHMIALGVVFLLMGGASVLLLADRILQIVLMGLVSLVLAVGLLVSQVQGLRLAAALEKSKKEAAGGAGQGGEKGPA